jgi:CDP-glucose 4,6-dehydratase
VLSGLKDKITDLRGDIRDGNLMKEIFQKYQPEIVFHLAAQPLVRLSYEIPVETYETNVMGTINIMEAIRATHSVKVGVMITTDKCYENKEQIWGYRENEPMGGYDPYSSSKGAAEIAIASWRRSFFNPEQYDKHGKSIASVRAGNVIGGGDWATDRIIPDCIRALEVGKSIEIRSPKAIRPWQHVLEPLSGYLLLAKKMGNDPTKYCEGWNFGPRTESITTVWDVATKVIENYGTGKLKDLSDPNALHEANLLMLDISKAKFQLGWEPRMNMEQCVALTVDWYKRHQSMDCYNLCVEQIERYLSV